MAVLLLRPRSNVLLLRGRGQHDCLRMQFYRREFCDLLAIQFERLPNISEQDISELHELRVNRHSTDTSSSRCRRDFSILQTDTVGSCGVEGITKK
jgi:hypothetical protein